MYNNHTITSTHDAPLEVVLSYNDLLGLRELLHQTLPAGILVNKRGIQRTTHLLLCNIMQRFHVIAGPKQISMLAFDAM